MANGFIVYKGKYGATRQYAEWISEETGLKVLTPEQVDDHQLQISRFMIICSSVYVGKLLISKWLRRNYRMLWRKKLFLVIVCATPSSERAKQLQIIQRNIPELLIPESDVSFLPGRLVIASLSWKDRMILRLGSRFEKDPAKKTAMKHDINGVKKENIVPITDKVKAYTQGETDRLLSEN